MATIRLGRNVLVKYDVNGVGGAGASWSTIALQVDRGMDGSTETTDGSTVSDVGWRRDIVTGQSWNITCSARWDPADSVHAALRNAWQNATAVYIQLDESSIGGLKREAQAYVKKFSTKYSKDGLVDVDMEFAMQGAPVISSV